MSVPLPPDRLSDIDKAAIDRLLAGELSTAEIREFEQRLQNDTAFRKGYIARAGLECDLEAVFLNEAHTDGPSAAIARAPVHGPAQGARWAFAAAALVLALVLTAVALPGRLPRVELTWPVPAAIPPARALDVPRIAVNSSEARHAQPVAAAEVQPTPRELRQAPESVPQKAHSVAVILDAQGLAADDESGLARGRRLPAGGIRIEQGHLLIGFLGGATLVLEGPAELILQSVGDATLLRGQAAVRDAGNGTHFRLHVPDAAIVDLGTEFAVRTDTAGDSIVRVHEGLVSISILDQHGSTQTDGILSANETALVRPHDRTPISLDASTDEFARVPRAPLFELRADDDYATTILSARPLVYWRFSGLDDESLIADLGSAQCRGKLYNRDARADVTLSDGHASFTRTGGPRWIESERALSDLVNGEYSVEFWVQTQEVGWQTIFGLRTPRSAPIQRSAVSIELTFDSHFVHGPMAFRAAIGNPQKRFAGVNLFGEDRWVPGAWHHVALLHGLETSRLFIDGHAVAHCENVAAGDDAPYRIVLGQLTAFDGDQQNPRNLLRQFAGSIDELALYTRLLTEPEIAAHHRQAAP